MSTEVVSQYINISTMIDHLGFLEEVSLLGMEGGHGSEEETAARACGEYRDHSNRSIHR